MSKQSWEEVVSIQGAGATITSAAEALLMTDVTIPAGYMDPNRLLHLHATGKASNVITTPGTLTIKLRWGGIAGTVLVTSAALTQNVIAQTDKTWTLDLWVQCLTAGATGTFLTWGRMQRGNCAAAASSDITPDLLPAASNAAVTVDTTTAKALSLTATPSLGTASITMLGMHLISKN